jgi:zinc ribbon protein
MPDETPASSRCPWCSASVPAGVETCPSCGAALVGSGEGVPGVSVIDTEAVLRNRSAPKPRGGLLGFLSGETGDTVDTPSEAEMASLAPPDTNVRIEMLRLELEAERQRLESEGAVLASEVAEEDGTPIPAGLFGDASEIPSGSSATPAAAAPTPPGPEAKPPATPPPGPEATPGA